MTRITPDEFRVWTQYVHVISGITLDSTKGYLLEHRLADLLRETNSSTFSELFYKVKAESAATIRRRVIDALTTRETSFFRDSSPFDLLQQKVLPDAIDAKTRAGNGRMPLIRIWSAACSSGQEVYSIGMVVRELQGPRPAFDAQILGTDLSDQAVAQASYAVYSKGEIERGLPPDRLRKYFTPLDDRWKVRDDVRGLATFRQVNLMEPFPFLNKFDIIFCRNVAIYFGEADKRRLFDRLGQMLEPHGALIIGSTESITGLCPQFEAQRHMRSVFYRLGAPAAPQAIARVR